jgi:hypothetical protein
VAIFSFRIYSLVKAKNSRLGATLFAGGIVAVLALAI